MPWHKTLTDQEKAQVWTGMGLSEVPWLYQETYFGKVVQEFQWQNTGWKPLFMATANNLTSPEKVQYVIPEAPQAGIQYWQGLSQPGLWAKALPQPFSLAFLPSYLGKTAKVAFQFANPLWASQWEKLKQSLLTLEKVAANLPSVAFQLKPDQSPLYLNVKFTRGLGFEYALAAQNHSSEPPVLLFAENSNEAQEGSPESGHQKAFSDLAIQIDKKLQSRFFLSFTTESDIHSYL